MRTTVQRALLGVLKLVERGPLKRQLHRDGVLLQKVFDGVVVGLIAKLARDNPDDLTVIDRGIELLEIQNVGGERLGKLLWLATGFGGALIEETEHAVLEEPPGLV